MKNKLVLTTILCLAAICSISYLSSAECKGGTATVDYECIAGEPNCVLSTCTDCGPFTQEIQFQ
jgi:hypothetical protein